MNTVIYWLARGIIALIQALPIRIVARLGRAGGGLAFFLTARYRRVTLDNLAAAFPEKSATEIREIAKENFRRIGENYASAIKTAAMTPLQMLPHFEFAGAEKILVFKDNDGPQSRIVAIGHFGNFELYARFGQFVPVFKCAATYRGLNQPALNRLLVALRNTSTTRFYERRTESAELRAAMSDTGLLLGLLADQHAGKNGLRLPFFGRDCSTSAAPAVFALRYNCPLHTAVCYRIGLAKWRIEVGDEIPTRANGEPRSSAEIMRDVNAEFEKAICRDPANWFWVHRRWKPVEPKAKSRRVTPPSAICHLPSAPRILIRGTNWLGDAVMTTSALLRLREKFSDAHITLLTQAKLADLWQQHPAINEIISFTAEDSVFAIAKKLHAHKFDLALVLPNSPRSALEVFLAGIPQRIGYARPWRNFFLTQTVASRAGAVKMHKRSVAEIKGLIAKKPEARSQKPEVPKAAHQIFEYLNLTAALGANAEPLAPQLFVMPEEIQAVKIKFGLDKITVPIFGLNPGAEYGPAKRWPTEKFVVAARQIQEHTNGAFILFGGKNDAALTHQIEAAIENPKSKVFNLAGRTSLRELMALLTICRVVLTNDTGPMHVAAALGTPVVVPFGSTSPELTGPGLPGDARNYLLKADAPCAPCFLRKCPIDFRCLNDIGIDSAVAAVLSAARLDQAT